MFISCKWSLCQHSLLAQMSVCVFQHLIIQYKFFKECPKPYYLRCWYTSTCRHVQTDVISQCYDMFAHNTQIKSTWRQSLSCAGTVCSSSRLHPFSQTAFLFSRLTHSAGVILSYVFVDRWLQWATPVTPQALRSHCSVYAENTMTVVLYLACFTPHD